MWTHRGGKPGVGGFVTCEEGVLLSGVPTGFHGGRASAGRRCPPPRHMQVAAMHAGPAQGIRWEDFYAYQHYAQTGAARGARGW